MNTNVRMHELATYRNGGRRPITLAASAAGFEVAAEFTTGEMTRAYHPLAETARREFEALKRAPQTTQVWLSEARI